MIKTVLNRPAAAVMTWLLLNAVVAWSAPPSGSPAVITAGKAASVTLAVTDLAPQSRPFIADGGPAAVKTLRLPAELFDVVIDQDLAYAAAGHSGLYVVNLGPQTADRPLLLVRHSVGDDVRCLEKIGDMLYLGSKGGIYSIDIHDPLNPQTLGYVATEDTVTALAATKQHLAALTGDGSIYLIDVRQPERMHVLASRTLPATGRALAMDDTRLLVADDEQGVLAFSHRDGNLPLAGQYLTTGPAIDIQLDHDSAYVATGTGGLVILDVSEPGNMTWTGSHQQLGDVWRLRFSHDRVLAENRAGQFFSVDVSNPVMPSVLASLAVDRTVTGYRYDGDTAVTAGNQQMTVYDFSAESPALSNEGLDFGQGVNFGGQRRVYIQDDIAYVADWFSGIHIYDIREPRRPRLLSSYHTGGSPKGIVVRDDYAFVADDDHGLQIINVHDPRRPFRVSGLPTAGLAYIPVLDGNRLYLASHRGGFQIIDISDVTQPRLLGEHDTAGKTWAIRVRGNYAYIADDDAGLVVFDVSDPQNIRTIGQFNPGGDAEDVILDGDVAYVAFFDNGVYIVDIRDPGFPKKLSHVPTPGNARGLALHDHDLYVADWLSGVRVIDVADPKAAKLIGQYDTSGAAWGLAIAEHYAYVMDWWGGFVVLDISHPQRPLLAGQYLQRERVRQMAARGNILYVADSGNGLQIFDINNPLNPTWMTGVDLPGPATGVALIDDYVYAVYDGNRMAVINVENPYQAEQVATRRLPLSVQRLTVQGHMLMMGQHDKGIYFYQTDGRARKPKKIAGLKIAWRDFTMFGDRLLVVTDKGHLAVYQRSERGGFEKQAEIIGDYNRLVTTDTYIVAASDNGLDLVVPGKDVWRLIGQLPVAGVTALAVQSGMVMAATAKSELYRIGVDEHGPAIVARQHVLSPVQDMLIHQDHIYISGGDAITAVSPLPAVTFEAQAGHSVTADIPADMPVGSYDLGVLEPGGTLTAEKNAMTVAMPVFAKPAITLDEIRKKLKTIQQGQ